MTQSLFHDQPCLCLEGMEQGLWGAGKAIFPTQMPEKTGHPQFRRERQSELRGWSSTCTERRLGNGVQFTGCQYTYIYLNFYHTRSTFVYFAHRVSGIFFHLALDLLRLSPFINHTKCHPCSQLHVGQFLGYIIEDALLKEFTVSLEIPVLYNGIKEKTKQGRT